MTSFGNIVCRKVKTMAFKALLKTPEDMLGKGRNLGRVTAVISHQQINGLSPFISMTPNL